MENKIDLFKGNYKLIAPDSLNINFQEKFFEKGGYWKIKYETPIDIDKNCPYFLIISNGQLLSSCDSNYYLKSNNIEITYTQAMESLDKIKKPLPEWLKNGNKVMTLCLNIEEEWTSFHFSHIRKDFFVMYGGRCFKHVARLEVELLGTSKKPKDLLNIEDIT